MAGSVNKVILVGNVGRDPEIRSTQDGTKIASLSIATSETWKDRNSGERKERTEWHRVVIFNENLVDVVEKYVHKGTSLYLEGSLQTRKWTDQSGAEKYTTEIVLQKYRGEMTILSSKREGNGDYSSPSPTVSSGSNKSPAYSGSSQNQVKDDFDDDIPF